MNDKLSGAREFTGSWIDGMRSLPGESRTTAQRRQRRAKAAEGGSSQADEGREGAAGGRNIATVWNIKLFST